MLKCSKCQGRVFLDRRHSTYNHLETFCILCGTRKFYHPPQDSNEGRWILQKELLLAKNTITNL
jgi:hypothetical protein